jgi:hypothetical protein
MEEPKMVSMERSKKEMRANDAPISIDSSKFPYGTCLHLSTSEMEKLGLDVTTLEVGAKVKLSAVGEITSVSSSKYTGGKDQSCSIQITSMALSDDLTKKGNKAYRDARRKGAGTPE